MEEGFLEKFRHRITLQGVISAETARWSRKPTLSFFFNRSQIYLYFMRWLLIYILPTHLRIFRAPGISPAGSRLFKSLLVHPFTSHNKPFCD